MTAFYIIFFLLVIGAITFLTLEKFYLKENEKRKNIINKILKISSIVMVSLSFINVFLPDAFSLRFIWDFNYLNNNHDAPHALLRMLNAVGVVLIPIVYFFKKDNLNKIVTYYMLPISIINAIFYFKYIGYYTSELTLEYATVFGTKAWPFFSNIVFRSLVFGIINFLSIVLCYANTINNLDSLKFKDKKSVGIFIATLVALLITNLPIYTFQQMFGIKKDLLPFNMGSIVHIGFILLIIGECISLYFIFRNQSYENRYILLLIMTISLMFQYNTFFRTEGIITAQRYPLQLCNIAGAFMLITLLTKNEKMWHFTITINLLGAFIAIAICDSTRNYSVFYEMNIHYMVEHLNVFLIPLLSLMLKMFKPLEKKHWKHMIIGFSIYYFSIFVLGTLFNTLDVLDGDASSYWECNYLFMFSKAKAVKLLGAGVGKLFDINFSIGPVTFYLPQLLVYLVFAALCSGVFFILYAFFKEKKNKNIDSNDNSNKEENIKEQIIENE